MWKINNCWLLLQTWVERSFPVLNSPVRFRTWVERRLNRALDMSNPLFQSAILKLIIIPTDLFAIWRSCFLPLQRARKTNCCLHVLESCLHICIFQTVSLYKWRSRWSKYSGNQNILFSYTLPETVTSLTTSFLWFLWCAGMLCTIIW